MNYTDKWSSCSFFFSVYTADLLTPVKDNAAAISAPWLILAKPWSEKGRHLYVYICDFLLFVTVKRIRIMIVEYGN